MMTMSFSFVTFSKKSIVVLSVLIILTIYCEISGWDFYIQDFFYDRERHAWMVDGSNPWMRQIFYTGPKSILVVLGGGLLSCVAYRIGIKKTYDVLDQKILLILLSLILVPAIIATLKELTYVHCPYNLRVYDGRSDFQNMLHMFSPMDPLNRGKCFPAGHASGGFALMSLYCLGRTRPEQWFFLSGGFALGWIMALYQMAKGAHFLSHSCMTMLLSWVIIVGIAHLLSFVKKT